MGLLQNRPGDHREARAREESSNTLLLLPWTDSDVYVFDFPRSLNETTAVAVTPA